MGTTNTTTTTTTTTNTTTTTTTTTTTNTTSTTTTTTTTTTFNLTTTTSGTMATASVTGSFSATGSSSDMTSLCASPELDTIVYNALNAVMTITWWNFVMAWCPSSGSRERRLQDMTQTISYELQFADVSLANTFGDVVGNSENKETIASTFISEAGYHNMTVTDVTVMDVTVTDNTELPTSWAPSPKLSLAFAACVFPGFF